MPLECETIASPDEPLQGLFIELKLPKLQQMIQEVLTYYPETFKSDFDEIQSQLIGMDLIAASGELTQLQQRLLQSLQCPLDAQMLGSGIVNELIYHILRSPYGQSLYALVNLTGHYGAITKIINQVQENIAKNYTVDELAANAGMSVSGFHRTFKQVTQESPLQYIKKMKLLRAKSLIIHEELSVGIAARHVGYESISQFSREFKRLFNVPPSQAKSINYAEVV